VTSTHDAREPRVSVVIPTRGRPEICARGVRSALGQTLRDIEVVVVIDGPDRKTEETLAQVTDPRLRVVPIDQHLGVSAARNHGVQASRAAWIAFLDDDDEWLPEKLQKQLASASESGGNFPIVSCRTIVRERFRTRIRPRRIYDNSEKLVDYLFCPYQFVQNHIWPTTLLAKRELLLKLPFDPRQERHEDWDFLLRASQEDGFSLVMHTEPLTIVNQGFGHRKPSWKISHNWLLQHEPMFTPAARCAFLLEVVANQAAAEKQHRRYWRLLFEALESQRPPAVLLLRYLYQWINGCVLRRC
jgi:glycosyltransferase involved in cell wall biosynthesis